MLVFSCLVTSACVSLVKEHTSFVQRHIIMQHIQNIQLRDISQDDALKIKGLTKFLGVHRHIKMRKMSKSM